jgi:hypothetical protein
MILGPRVVLDFAAFDAPDSSEEMLECIVVAIELTA